MRSFLAWCERNGRPPELDRPTVAAFTAGQLDDGLDAATVKSRQGSVRRFSKWLADEGEIDSDQLIGVKPPKLDQRIIEPFTDTEIKALIKACAVGDPFMARRDEALVRVMVECGLRAGEVISLALEDLDLQGGTAVVRRGKGGRGRVVPIGPHAVRALDRYIRARRTHKLASTPTLWLGGQNKGFAYDALYLALGARAKAAGLAGFHPHRLRHTAAHRWLAAGGSEGGLQAVAGWSSPAMLIRYTRARATDRAVDEARKLNLGDI